MSGDQRAMTNDANADLSRVIIALMKGVTYRDADPALWQALVSLSARVREHVVVLGLDLVLDEAEGYAYLAQRAAARGEGKGEPEIARLVTRRQLGYQVSLLIVLLRKRLAELDARGAETRLVMSRDEIVELVRVFLPDSANEAKVLDRVETHINKIVELGFLRRLRGGEDRYEVQRIIKAFVDAQWLSDYEERLAAYRAHAGGGAGAEGEAS
jgi:hypothetical protein